MARKVADLGPELISFALQQRPRDQVNEFFESFHDLFFKRFPITGERQLRKYLLICRRIMLVIRRQNPAEQMAVRREILTKIVNPVGATLDDNEFDATMARVKTIIQELITRYGLDVDPSEIPNFGEERVAEVRARRGKNALLKPEHDTIEGEELGED